MESEEEFKQKLPPEAYRVLREKGTEPPFTGKYHFHKDQGLYSCAACGNPLFRSEAKYESGCGWPSFYQPLPGGTETALDRSLGMIRTEVKCAKCGSHLGHVFDDGPLPTGERFCINSVALDFQKE